MGSHWKASIREVKLSYLHFKIIILYAGGGRGACHYFVNKGPSSQSYGFFSSHVWMWELDYKESWALKKWCFWTVVLEKTLESPLDCKENQPVHLKGYQSWVFIGRTDIETEAPILWPPDVKNWLIGKDPDAGKDWRWEEKGTTEDEIVGCHHRLNWHEFGLTLGVGDGQGGHASCRVGHDWVTGLNWIDRWTAVQSLSLSTSLWPHGLMHARLPYPSPSPKAYSNSYPLT